MPRKKGPKKISKKAPKNKKRPRPVGDEEAAVEETEMEELPESEADEKEHLPFSPETDDEDF